jgi:parvulin-like peptidyl-prolyl isomerase
MAGYPPEVLPAFSLSTQELPELGGRAGLNELKQAAFSTAIGQASGFVPTDDGGFVVYVESQQPVDETTMNAELPQFLASIRRSRQNEAFNEWLGMEARKQFGNLAIFQQTDAAK